MNEYERIKEKYFGGNTYLESSNKTKVKRDLNILLNIEQYGDENKGPDLVSKTKTKIYGIEHFEFDSTKNFRKGSQFRSQIGKIDNAVNDQIKHKDKAYNVSILSLNQSIKAYIDNYKKVYNYHYSRVPNYLEYLNKDFPSLEKEIWFFIEDVTPFGNHYFDKDCKPVLFHPMLSEELIELFEQSPQIKGIFFATSSYGNENKIYVYSNSKNEINKLKKNCKIKSVNSLIIQNPLCSTTLIKCDNLKGVE